MYTSTTFTLEVALFAGEDNLLVDWSEIATGYGGMVYAYNPSAQEVEQKDSVEF